MKITFVYPDDKFFAENVEWRCSAPARAINHTGRHSASLLRITDFNARSTSATRACEESDVILIYRDLWGKTLKNIEYWKARGKVLVGDFDAAYQLMGEIHPEYRFWYRREAATSRAVHQVTQPIPLVEFKWGVQLVDFLTLNSRRLVDDWKPYAATNYVPNLIDYERYLFNRRELHEGIVIGWKGNRHDLHSFKNSGAFEAVLEIIELKKQVHLLLCASDPDITTDLNLDQVNQRVILCNQKTWLELLSKIDIGIAPLYGEFDQRKGYANILEFMVKKIPWVGSVGSPYHELSRYGWLVSNQKAAWKRVLLDMISHIDEYLAEAEREPYLYGLSQGIEENIQIYIDHLARAPQITDKVTSDIY